MPAYHSFPARLFSLRAAVCLLLAGGLLLSGLSCSKKNAFNPTDPLRIANKWVYDSLKLYYYWNKEISSNPRWHLPTEQFFKQLLSNKDRFSWINNNQVSTYNKSTAELFGFHYALIPHPFQAQQMAGIVTMIIPGSKASLGGLERGMFFTKVNGAGIDASNQSAIEKSLTGSSVNLQLASFNSSQQTLNDSAVITLNQGGMVQQSLYGTRQFLKNGIKTGYLAYFLCNEFEDERLLQAIEKLKEASITELILDLRYNPGGSVASATKLAATLVSDFNPNNIFITYQGNEHGGKVQQSFAKAISFSGVPQGKDMNYLRGLNLNLKRIFLLVSQHTASAAELLANNLRPYLPVILIGSKTLGKDEASFKIEDKRVPKQIDWIILPTVYKIADANGNGNYAGGLIPDQAVDEFTRLPLQPLGMPGDKLVDKALQQIYGNTNVQSIELKIKRSDDWFENIELFYRNESNPYPIVVQP